MTAPGAPILTARNNGNLTASLFWDEPEGEPTSYTIYRDAVEVGTTSALAYVDDGLSENTEYAYTVTATNGDGEGDPSNEEAVWAFVTAEDSAGGSATGAQVIGPFAVDANTANVLNPLDNGVAVGPVFAAGTVVVKVMVFATAASAAGPGGTYATWVVGCGSAASAFGLGYWDAAGASEIGGEMFTGGFASPIDGNTLPKAFACQGSERLVASFQTDGSTPTLGAVNIYALVQYPA
jgi:cellulose 1,4-beta-cellobiosidase